MRASGGGVAALCSIVRDKFFLFNMAVFEVKRRQIDIDFAQYEARANEKKLNKTYVRSVDTTQLFALAVIIQPLTESIKYVYAFKWLIQVFISLVSGTSHLRATS